MKIFFSKKIFLFIFISLISISLSDNEKVLKSIELKQKVNGKMDKNDSREYFQLKLPKDVPQGSLLVFTVKESRKGIKEGEEIFSDPDIYVSKTLKFPSKREEAQWYSERYGNDILTIPTHAVDKDEIFYICMYCQYKCRYELNSYLSKEAPAELGKYYSLTLTRQSSISYALYVPENPKKEELNVIVNNPSFKNFKIFMAKESPSSQNTFQVIPSWNGGYVITINKYHKNYCTDCSYHLLFQTEEEHIVIQFTAYFQSTLTKITSGNPINDAVKTGSKRCYYFDTNNIDNIYKSKLVINTNLFSGSIFLNINGWKPKIEDNIHKVKKDEPYNYHIENNKIILLQKEDFENFDKGGYEEENIEGKKLYFCTYAQQMTSYMLNVYFLSEAQALQRFNFISPGSELTGYLQGGQLTSYRILDFNLNKNSIITLTFNGLEGKVDFFSTFCKENCNFNDELLKDRLQDGSVTLSSEVSYKKKNIIINPEDNKCYKEKMDDQINKCKTLIIVKCFGSSDDICSFKILPSINDQSIFMSQKKTYYNFIAKGKIDLYEIVVDDEEINSIVVVLTSVTGDAELQVDKVQENEGKTKSRVKVSRNKDYIPDVVRITPNSLGEKNVVGKYIVKVSAATFSSYNLYYYTTRVKSKDEQPNIKDVTLSLSEGNIIKDYFPNDISYKIFYYTPQTREKEDIKIILTRINVHFSFKVYLDFSKIKYNYDIDSKYQERLTDYDWASDFNNELTISKDDKKYSKNGPYYIVVTRDNTYQDDENEQLDINSLMSYYIGVTKKGVPFSLNEGVEHSETLSDKYLYQDYFYIHKDINNPLNLEVNVISGEVDFFVNVKEINKENITNIYDILEKNGINYEDENTLGKSLYMRFNIKDYASIQLNRDYFNQFCIKKVRSEIEDKSCFLYIYVVQSKSSRKYSRDSQYIINVKSSISSGILLLSGQVYNTRSKENITDHYIIEEVKHRKGISIHIKFKSGTGQIYARIPKIPELGKNMTYPDEKNYDYRGVETYMGKIVSIPSKVFDRINKNSIKLQILISVFPLREVGEHPNIEYSITYGSEPKRISQNIPYQSFLSPGEHHYFIFYFDEKAKNIYISLSNMNGDADMYLNYGNDNVPSTTNYHWYSTNIGHEYIDINVNDRFFKKNKKDNISGYYTLLVIGYLETTYTLYVSSHPDKIFPLVDNSPVSCKCQNQGEKCYFRYNNVFNGEYGNNKEKEIKRTEIIFTTQYIYGNGKMYASIYKDQELTDDPNKKYQSYFPTEKEFQFTNAITGKRNYLKVNVENQYYTKDSLILLTYICEEKTDVEITAASLKYNKLYSYLDVNRENMYYLKYNDSISFFKQEEAFINFYSSNDEDLIYEFHAYVGKARIKIFTNESIYNEKGDLVSFDYNHIAEFNLKAEDDNEYSSLKTYTEHYFNSIKNNLIFNKNIYFTVKPMSDFGFYIQVNYDRTWINIPIGGTKSYLINKDMMSGYFDINDEYSNVEMSLSLDEFMQKRAILYVKIVVLSKNAQQVNSFNKEDKLYHYEIPSNSNYDYMGATNDIMAGISININNLPIIKESERNNKFIRALFTIEIKNLKTRRRYSRGGQTDNKVSNENQSTTPQTKVTIAITPGINNFKRIDLPQRTYYFSNTSLEQNSNNGFYNNEIKQYDGYKEVKIYSLDKRSNADNKMIINIHKCAGNFNFKISNKIVDYDNNQNNIKIFNETDEYGEYGRSKFLIDNLKDKHIYLSIKPDKLPEQCDILKGKIFNDFLCKKELSYLIYYYSLTDQEYVSKKLDLNLKYRYSHGKHWEVKIIIKPLGGTDYHNNKREQKDIEYNIFWTTNTTLKLRLDNICYLSQILNRNEEEKFNDITQNGERINVMRNIEINENNELIISNLNEEEIYYVNVLARNLRTNELIAYIPLALITHKRYIQIKKYLISLMIFLFLILAIYSSFNYYKEKILKKDYVDIKNPKTIEMGSIGSKQGGYQRISL